MVGVEEEKPCGDPNPSVSPGNTSSEKMTILIFFFPLGIGQFNRCPSTLASQPPDVLARHQPSVTSMSNTLNTLKAIL